MNHDPLKELDAHFQPKPHVNVGVIGGARPPRLAMRLAALAMATSSAQLIDYSPPLNIPQFDFEKHEAKIAAAKESAEAKRQRRAEKKARDAQRTAEGKQAALLRLRGGL
jgi:hypothetical protein